ncbi:MAG: phosphotransferase system enzyme I (PtsP) [Rhodothermales bacterium]|jgi:phosphotransferase system enzyme I (PtsP)
MSTGDGDELLRPHCYWKCMTSCPHQRLIETQQESGQPGRNVQGEAIVAKSGILPANPQKQVPMSNSPETVIQGSAVVVGLGRGRVVHLSNSFSLDHITEHKIADPAAEEARFEVAVKTTAAELDELVAFARRELPEEVAIFEGMLLLLWDATFNDMVRSHISNGDAAEWAIKKVIGHFEDQFSRLKNAYMRERLSELENVGVRIIAALWGRRADRKVCLSEPSVLVTYDIAASELLGLDLDKVEGIVLGRAYKTAHVIIVAKSLNIPVIAGVEHGLQFIPEHSDCILDAESGTVIVNPSQQTQDEYARLQEKWMSLSMAQLQGRGMAGATADGVKVSLNYNVGTLAGLRKAVNFHRGGVGLFRTEFIYLQSADWPTEAAQFAVYRDALTITKGPVVFRTCDLGGDKILPYETQREEEAPFLGWRGIRRSLDDVGVFRTQLRALLRAATDGPARIMLPMISSVQQVIDAKAIIEETKAELAAEGIPYDAHIPVGMMVETPAAVWQADTFAQHVDFFSIGTNDLTQFTVAAGRNERFSSPVYDMYHPAVMLAVAAVAQAGARHDTPVSVCGEAAGCPLLAVFLVGCGIHNLSMSAPRIPVVKRTLAAVTSADAERIAKVVLSGCFAHGSEIRDFLRSEVTGMGLDLRECDED